MKKILTTLILLLSVAASFAQRYTTNSASEYQQLYSKKYTFVETTLDVECIWEVSDKIISRECHSQGVSNGGADWKVLKIVKIPNGKKYIMDAWGMDDIWVIVDQSGFIQLFENNGQTMRKFRITKKQAIK